MSDFLLANRSSKFEPMSENQKTRLPSYDHQKSESTNEPALIEFKNLITLLTMSTVLNDKLIL